MSQKIEYEWTDHDNLLYAQQQGEDNNNKPEPPDKVTKWFVFFIVLLGIITIYYEIKHH